MLSRRVSGRYVLTIHARLRMAERSVYDFDIRECGLNGKISVQTDGKFKIQGFDQDGDDLTLICIDNGDVLIVTLF